MATGIEWTEETWNPLAGCSKISPGCKGCYAIRMARRLKNTPAYKGLTTPSPVNWTGVVRALDERLLQPLRWKRPRLVFVNSMSDLFHEGFTDDQIDKIFAVMAASPRHTFQILTKRSRRMRDYFSAAGLDDRIDDMFNALAMEDDAAVEPFHKWVRDGRVWPLPNVWMGVSVESADYEDRVRDLGAIEAAVRWVSYEPALGPLNWWPHWVFLDWVVAGGESGAGARAPDPQWFRWAREFCAGYDIPYFFKQWGNWRPRTGEEYFVGSAPMVRTTKKDAGAFLDGLMHREFPRSQQSQISDVA